MGSIGPDDMSATPDRPGLSSDADGPSAARSDRVRPLASVRSPHMSMTRALPAAWARPKAESNDSTGSGDVTAITPNRPGGLPIPTISPTV